MRWEEEHREAENKIALEDLASRELERDPMSRDPTLALAERTEGHKRK